MLNALHKKHFFMLISKKNCYNISCWRDNMKYVYLFSEGNKDMRNLLGGNGANLAEMTKLG